MKDNKSENPKPIRKIPNKKVAPKPPRFNIMWLYAVVILVLLGVGYLSSNNVVKTISYQFFDSNILKQHDAEKLVAYKNGDLVVVEVYIKKDSLSKKPQYSDVREQKSITGTNSNGPQSQFTDASYESLKQTVTIAEKGLPD